MKDFTEGQFFDLPDPNLYPHSTIKMTALGNSKLQDNSVPLSECCFQKIQIRSRFSPRRFAWAKLPGYRLVIDDWG